MFKNFVVRLVLASVSIAAIITGIWAVTFPEAATDYTILILPMACTFFFGFRAMSSSSDAVTNWGVGLILASGVLICLRIHDPSGWLVFLTTVSAVGIVYSLFSFLDWMTARQQSS